MKVKEFATIVGGSTPSSRCDEYYGGDIVWVTPKDLSDQGEKYIFSSERYITQNGYNSCSTTLLPIGSIIMSSRAPIGLLAITSVPCCTNQGCKSFNIDNEQCDSEYLYYYLKLHIKEIENLGSGTTFKEVSKESIEDFDIELPDINAQRKIVSIIKNLDSKISTNNTISSTLESLAKLIYDYWFVQFDFPDENGKPYKSSGGKMVWNEELKREIPKGWKVVNVDQLCSITSGYPFDSKSYVDDGEYQVLTIKNIQDGYIINTTDSKISSVPYGFPECDILNIGDILMSLTGNVGRIGILCAEKFLLNQRASVINSKDSNNKWYLYFLFRNKVFFNKIQRIATGTSQKNVSPIDIGNIRILHSAKIAKLFTNKVKDLVERLILCNIENQYLASLRDFLLPMLMNGQVTIKD